MPGGGGGATVSNVTIGTSAAQIVDGTSSRDGLLIVNNHATNTLYVGTSSSVTTANGLPVLAGGSITFTDYLGPVFGIASAASTDVRYWETF